MRRIVGEAHDEAVQLLSDNRERLESLADALFQAETLEGPEAYAAAGLAGPGRRASGGARNARGDQVGAGRAASLRRTATRDGSRSSTSP